MDDKKLLKEYRRGLVKKIEQAPGQTIQTLMSMTNLSRDDLLVHLAWLIAHGKVVVYTSAGRRYFATSSIAAWHDASVKIAEQRLGGST